MAIICHEQTDWSVCRVRTHLTVYMILPILYIGVQLFLCIIVWTCYKSKCNDNIDVLLLLYNVMYITIFLLYFVFIQKENRSHGATYTENCKSMLRYNYDCVFFVVRKPS